jgi:DNA (cytosine-5)-methyltransferase 1
LKVVSLFSGAGGLDLGFKWANFDLIFANDIEMDACKTYEKHIGAHIVPGDINSLIKDLPSADIVIGGPPCQGFSLAGKRNPKDHRNQLPWQFLEYVEIFKPKAVLMEKHGITIVSESSLWDAYYLLEALEHLAIAYYVSVTLKKGV